LPPLVRMVPRSHAAAHGPALTLPQTERGPIDPASLKANQRLA
jgi:hypothetical protein